VAALLWLALVPREEPRFFLIAFLAGGGSMPVIGALLGMFAAVLSRGTRQIVNPLVASATNIALVTTFAFLVIPG
jgi:hypothetical protein